MTDQGFVCSRCGSHHQELPLNYSTMAPDIWDEGLSGDPESMLSLDHCVVTGEFFFIKGLIEIPVIDTGETFRWGVWASVRREDFIRNMQLWESPGREYEEPYRGTLATGLDHYTPSTYQLRVDVHTRPVGIRPIVAVRDYSHPLSAEQRKGMTRRRAQCIAETVLHPVIDAR
jgi:hypothetical protein